MTKKLYRSYIDRKIAGVCGGIAEYFDIDPVLVRALFIITTISYAVGFIAYIVLWIIVPERPKPIFSSDFIPVVEEEEQQTEINSNKLQSRTILGIILLVLGVLFFINEFFPIWDRGIFFSIILIIIGVLLLITKKSEK